MLAGAFAIDVGGFAILDNHFHVVVRTDPERAASWTPHQVATRWFELCGRSVREWASRRSSDAHLSDHEVIELLARDERRIAEFRTRLADLSWFMKLLKERDPRRSVIQGTHTYQSFRPTRILTPNPNTAA